LLNFSEGATELALVATAKYGSGETERKTSWSYTVHDMIASKYHLQSEVCKPLTPSSTYQGRRKAKNRWGSDL